MLNATKLRFFLISEKIKRNYLQKVRRTVVGMGWRLMVLVGRVWSVGHGWSGSVGGGDHGEEGVFVDDGDAEGACLFELGGTHIFAGEDVIGFARD